MGFSKYSMLILLAVAFIAVLWVFTGFSEALRHMPRMSAGETFKYILMQFLIAVVVAVVNGVWVFVLIAFVLPFLLSGLFS